MCNTALFVTVQDPETPENGTSALAPVQCTPFFTGIVGRPNAVDANQRPVGGGGVTSFAFASSLASVTDDDDRTVTVQQPRQWALADIVGTSSAAFAQTVHDTLVDLAANPPRFAAALAMHGEDAVRLIARSGGDAPSARTFIASRVASARSGNVGILDSELADFGALIPRYQYWPVRGAAPAPNIAPTDFADGGSLENSGIAAMLAYRDIDNVVAFVDTLATLAQDSNGVVIVDDSIPPLFGYRPYDSTVKDGYAPYSTGPIDATSAASYYRFNQVFPSDDVRHRSPRAVGGERRRQLSNRADLRAAADDRRERVVRRHRRQAGHRGVGLSGARRRLVRPAGLGRAVRSGRAGGARGLPALRHAQHRADAHADQPAREPRRMERGEPEQRRHVHVALRARGRAAGVNETTADQFALVGAGPIGLCVARALAQHGIPYVQFESANAVGGNWRDGVYETAHIISSRKTTEFSDYPMPADYPDFPSGAQMLAYLQDYARHYDLEKNIAFGTTVRDARPVFDGGAERWELTFADGARRVYKGVIACVGHHWDRRWPSYPGTFGGELIHSKDYKTPEQLRGKRVLVIGGGNSACDIASEAARVAASSHLSNRRGYWFLPKTLFGVPLVELIPPWAPLWLQRIGLRAALAVAVGDYARYGLQKPDHAIFEHHPTINSELLHYVKHGRITPHPTSRGTTARSSSSSTACASASI